MQLFARRRLQGAKVPATGMRPLPDTRQACADSGKVDRDPLRSRGIGSYRDTHVFRILNVSQDALRQVCAVSVWHIELHLKPIKQDGDGGGTRTVDRF